LLFAQGGCLKEKIGRQIRGHFEQLRAKLLASLSTHF